MVIPTLPGLFSALGLLFSGVEHHDVRSCRLSDAALTEEALTGLRADMERGMLAQFAAEGFPADQVQLSAYADVRFLGQASEIRLPMEDGGPPIAAGRRKSEDEILATDYRLPTTLRSAFLAEHERLYGHRSDPDNPIEVVAVRLIGRAGAPDPRTLFRPVASSSVGRRPTFVRSTSALAGGWWRRRSWPARI